MNAKQTFRKFMKQPPVDPEPPFPSQRKLRERQDLEFLFIRNPQEKVVQVNGSMDCTVADPHFIPSNFKEFKGIELGTRGCSVTMTDGSSQQYACATMVKTTILGKVVTVVEKPTIVTLKETDAKILCYFGTDDRGQQYILDVEQSDQPSELMGHLETANLNFGIPFGYGRQPAGMDYTEVAAMTEEVVIVDKRNESEEEEELLSNQALVLYAEANAPGADPNELDIYRPTSPTYHDEEVEVITKNQDYINDEVNRLTKIALSRVALVEKRNQAKGGNENVDPTFTTFTDKQGRPMSIEQAMEDLKRKSAQRQPRRRT